MVRIVFEEGLEAIAKRIADAVDGDAMKLENALEAPCALEEVESIGIVYAKQGKDIGEDVIKLVREGLGSIELRDLGYMFSICVCNGDAKPQYALKVVNRLCSQIGCLPSYSRAISKGDDSALQEVCRDVSMESIRLADGSPFVGLYMKANKRRFSN